MSLNINHPYDIKKFSLKKLKTTAQEIRNIINETVQKNGGHLGPNLGAVEIILACHHVFHLDKDRLVFDVGHQSYAHKIIAKRNKNFTTLRQKGGISGYPHQGESPFDVFRSGHASTAISTSLGILEGFLKNKKTQKQKAIALVGDGSLTGGIAFEGLNHAGELQKNLIVILNDNSMSISPTVGGLSKALNDFRHQKNYYQLRDQILKIVKKVPKIGENIEKTTNQMLQKIKNIVTPSQIFINLGFDYIGPIDGHDLKELITALKIAKSLSQPVIIHALTQKGIGYKTSKNSLTTLGPHALSGNKVKESNNPLKIPRENKSYSEICTDYLIKLARKNKKIIAITAAMLEGTKLDAFAKQYPDRCYDVGICEAHATAFAAGLSAAKFQPVFFVYSTFLQRAFDQIFHDIILQKKIPVVFAIDRAGLVGDDGPSHHGTYDISYLRLFPDIVLMAPKDGKELTMMLSFALSSGKTCAIRYPKSNVVADAFFQQSTSLRSRQKISSKKTIVESPKIEMGIAEVLQKGKEICLYAYGEMVAEAYQVAKKLQKNKINVTVINARFAKPIDSQLLKKLVKTHRYLVTIEEATLAAGFGSAVLESINQLDLADKIKVKCLGLPDDLVEHATREEQLIDCHLDSDSIFKFILSLMKKNV